MAKRPQGSKPEHPIHFKRKVMRLVVGLFVWAGIAVIYYLVFSFFFDTPAEHSMRQSLVQLEREYEKLSERYDTLGRVLENVSERDRAIFRTLYDSEPLQYDDGAQRLRRVDTLMGMTNKELAQAFFSRFDRLQDRAADRRDELERMQARFVERGAELNRIPSIQPVINPDLTQIATSFGMRVHPFYRTMVMHNGMDYAVPEGTRVFATADGTVTFAGGGQSSSGISVTIDHGEGFNTSYHHLSRVLTRQGAKVRRGDIIALTGNTGLSLAPHLHYEISLNGSPVDPAHYFSYELGPLDYERVKRQASVGMQSFD